MFSLKQTNIKSKLRFLTETEVFIESDQEAKSIFYVSCDFIDRKKIIKMERTSPKITSEPHPWHKVMKNVKSPEPKLTAYTEILVGTLYILCLRHR